VSGYAGTEGNEETDQAAKRGAKKGGRAIG